MRKTDRELGMHQSISRRDFVQGAGLSALGLALPGSSWARTGASSSAGAGEYYPPTLTGLRGSHPGSFEVAHALAREGRRFENPRDINESYDLVVTGAGISGLAATWYYRQRFGPGARILLLENHDDFGGHAKRNEFHQDEMMRLVAGGTQNFEYSMFSERVSNLLQELGIDIQDLVRHKDFHYGASGYGPPAIYFDAETYGRNVLVRDFALRYGSRDNLPEKIGQFPLSESTRQALVAFYARNENLLEGMNDQQVRELLHGTSYTDFLRNHGGLPEEAVRLFINSTHGYDGSGADCLSVAECEGAGLPLLHLLGRAGQEPTGDQGGDVAMYPDGNATLARLLVRALIPAVDGGQGTADIALRHFDYSQLDRATNPVRLRLNSTVVRAENQDSENQASGGVEISYVNGGELLRVRARHAVMACYHVIVPHLCPELPNQQQEALRYQVKHPLLSTSVLLRSAEPFRKLGISSAYCPGRLHGMVWPWKGINTGGYEDRWEDQGPLAVQFWGSLQPPVTGLALKDQLRASRTRLLAMDFADFEREVRTVLDGLLGPAGFDVTSDILAITVNRWPHGYSYGYHDLWDPQWSPGEAPHEKARQPFGSISIANADAGAQAFTHTAIDQAYRAVSELPA
ncbi:MAG TPA: FAD/NAD(P)-binding protein [Xanthomonadales bacterium]|nr:FAD/NAD(P)-binding protein [Xanthomonadales bacterium]